LKDKHTEIFPHKFLNAPILRCSRSINPLLLGGDEKTPLPVDLPDLYLLHCLASVDNAVAYTERWCLAPADDL
jgi:hypothetical protein